MIRHWIGLASIALGMTAVLVARDPLHWLGAQWHVTAVGGLALGLAGLALASERSIDSQHWEAAAVGTGLSVPEPGRDLDDLSEAAFRQRVREHVVDALVAHGHAPDRAQALVDEGAWTDDPVAAHYLAETSLRDEVLYAVAAWSEDAGSTETIRRRAVAALVSLRQGGDG